MTLEDLRTLCNELPGVTEDVKWEQDLCFLVGEKMFLTTSLDKMPVSASFKVPAEDFEELLEDERFAPAPYLARYHWVMAPDIQQVSGEEWEHFIRQSYRLVREKLPKKVQSTLGEPL